MPGTSIKIDHDITTDWVTMPDGMYRLEGGTLFQLIDADIIEVEGDGPASIRVCKAVAKYIEAVWLMSNPPCDHCGAIQAIRKVEIKDLSNYVIRTAMVCESCLCTVRI